MQGIKFDYFHGMEAGQYSFYRIPKMLFTAECFKSLSCEAIILYGLMLDRMGLSIKNRWLDEEDRVYIVFTVEEIAELMDCGMQKAVKLVKELDADQGIGLIEKKRLGLGKPNVIYVKNFIVKDDFQLSGRDSIPVNDRAAQEGAEINSGCIEAAEDEETSSTSLPETEAEKTEESTSGVFKIKNQELLKSQSNNTELNNTDFSKTDPINPYPSDVIDKMDRYRDAIRKNISHGCFLNGGSCQREELDELVDVMMPDYAAIWVAGVERSAIVVKERFMKLDYSHIAYVLGCLRTNTSEVRNIKSYLLTSLYNVALTIDNYYRVEAKIENEK